MNYLVALTISITYVLLNPTPAGVWDTYHTEWVTFTPPTEGKPGRRDGGGTH